MSNDLELIESYGLLVNFKNSLGFSEPSLRAYQILGGKALHISIQEEPLSHERVKHSVTNIEFPIGTLSISGTLGGSVDAKRVKGRTGHTSDTGDLHLTDIIYSPGWFVLVTGSNFDFNSPISARIARNNMARLSTHSRSQIREKHGIRVRNLRNHDVVGQQKMSQWPNSDERVDWSATAVENIGNALAVDRQAPYSRHVLPNTQIELGLQLQELWGYQSLFLGELHRDIDLASNSVLGNEWFAYNFNAIFQYITFLIPLFEPIVSDYSRFTNIKPALMTSLSSNADLLGTLGTDPKGASQHAEFQSGLIGWGQSGFGAMNSVANRATLVDSNKNVDRLLARLKVSEAMTPRQVEDELARKAASGTYLTLATIRDVRPTWSSLQSAHSTAYPTQSECSVDDLTISSQTDGVTHLARNGADHYAQVTPYDQLAMAAHWQEVFESDQLDQNVVDTFAKADDGSQLINEFTANRAWKRING